jgi:hypothetical protein
MTADDVERGSADTAGGVAGGCFPAKIPLWWIAANMPPTAVITAATPVSIPGSVCHHEAPSFVSLIANHSLIVADLDPFKGLACTQREFFQNSVRSAQAQPPNAPKYRTHYGRKLLRLEDEMPQRERPGMGRQGSASTVVALGRCSNSSALAPLGPDSGP